MSKTEELRSEANELQKSIGLLVTKFIEKNGPCSIIIDCQPSFNIMQDKSKRLACSNISVDVTI